MSPNVLPDSRTRERKGVIQVGGVNYVPVYCINCGRRYGLVPESHITHVTALCDSGCSGKYGHTAHLSADRDTALRQGVAEVHGELVRKLGRPITATELDEMARSGAEPKLAALYRDWQARVRQES
jgi:hypothetical protein